MQIKLRVAPLTRAVAEGRIAARQAPVPESDASGSDGAF
jgi:hypothetical protein